MDEYIKRETAVAIIKKHMANVNEHSYSVNHNKEQYDIYAMATNHAIDYVRIIPAADVVEVVHGRWVYDHWCEFKCSICGEWSKSEPYRGKENYCPNCGAKMDLEESSG